MKTNLVGAACVRTALVVVLAGLSVMAGEPTASGWRTVNVFQTNRSPRVVTNVIEVRVPDNVFVNEYRTNMFARTVTNLVEVPVTNWSSRQMTNRVTVTAFRTNVVNRYQTNWTTHTKTNVEEVTATNWDTVVVTTTNWSTKAATNVVAVTAFRTNMVERPQTNWTTVTLTNRATVTLTNWETVSVTKTNWIKQPPTNEVAVHVPIGVLKVMAREPAPPLVPPSDVPKSDSVPDILVVEANKTARPTDSSGAEVYFKVWLASEPEMALQIQQWRVERDDGAVLISSQAQEFKRVLPPGRYQVLVRARRNADRPMLAQQSSLNVTADAVTRR